MRPSGNSLSGCCDTRYVRSASGKDDEEGKKKKIHGRVTLAGARRIKEACLAFAIFCSSQKREAKPATMLGAILLAIACASFVRAQEGEILVSNNKTQCVNDMVEWCNGMQYPQQGAGLSMLSITYEDPYGYYRVFCSSDSEGTNCTRNKRQWFSCTPNHTLAYKGRALSANTSDGVDDDICTTADKAFNDLFVQNLSYDNTTLKNEVQKGLEAFFDEMAAMQEQIDVLTKRINTIPFFSDNFWGGILDGFIIEGPVAATGIPGDDKQNATQQINEIKENK